MYVGNWHGALNCTESWNASGLPCRLYNNYYCYYYTATTIATTHINVSSVETNSKMHNAFIAVVWNYMQVWKHFAYLLVIAHKESCPNILKSLVLQTKQTLYYVDEDLVWLQTLAG